MATILVTPAGASSLGVIDALSAETDHDLVAADASEFASGFRRDAVTGYVVSRLDEAEAAYIDRLADIIESESVDVLIPGADRDVLAVGRNRDRFQDAVELVLPPQERIETATDGLRSVRVAGDAGVTVPATYETPGDAEADGASFPLFVKPRREEGGRGARRVESWDELRFFYSRIDERIGTPVIQEHIPGGTGTMHVVGLLYDRDGRLTTSFTSRSLRTNFSWGGGGVVGQPVDRPELVGLATAIVNHLGGWVGPINMEFKYDVRDGTPTFIEINPRLWGYNHVATINGVNFPSRLVDICLGRDVNAVDGLGGDQVLLIDAVEEVE